MDASSLRPACSSTVERRSQSPRAVLISAPSADWPAGNAVEHNPYAAPRAWVADVGPGNDVQLATRGQRFANFVLDTIGYYVLIVIVAVALSLANPDFADMLADEGAGTYVVVISLMLLYYVSCESLFGRTPAKLLTGTRVVAEDGSHPTLRKVLGRSLARMVPFEPFSCLGAPPVGWHDHWSRTRVVRTRPNPALGPAYSLAGSEDDQRPIRLGL